jgi:hypothetical protein
MIQGEAQQVDAEAEDADEGEGAQGTGHRPLSFRGYPGRATNAPSSARRQYSERRSD